MSAEKYLINNGLKNKKLNMVENPECEIWASDAMEAYHKSKCSSPGDYSTGSVTNQGIDIKAKTLIKWHVPKKGLAILEYNGLYNPPPILMLEIDVKILVDTTDRNQCSISDEINSDGKITREIFISKRTD